MGDGWLGGIFAVVFRMSGQEAPVGKQLSNTDRNPSLGSDTMI